MRKFGAHEGGLILAAALASLAVACAEQQTTNNAEVAKKKLLQAVDIAHSAGDRTRIPATSLATNCISSRR